MALTTSTLLALSALATPRMVRAYQTIALRHTCQRSRSLVLTFDDGPGTILTPKLLDLLAAYHAPATFFLLGSKATAFPHIVKSIQEHGHDIGCHGQYHRKPSLMVHWAATANIHNGFGSLAPWLAPQAPFRPPFGKLHLPELLSLLFHKIPVAWWTLDSGDTFIHPPKPQTVTETLVRTGGGVVLLHDFDRSCWRGEYTLDLTERLLQTAQQENIHVCRFSDLMQAGNHEETSLQNPCRLFGGRSLGPVIASDSRLPGRSGRLCNR